MAGVRRISSSESSALHHRAACRCCCGGACRRMRTRRRHARGGCARRYRHVADLSAWLLSIAAFLCCVAMAIPQVHIVAYCGDLGYGVARGAEMLSLMLGFGVVSRIASGFIADKIGGLPTLLVGSMMQAVAMALYLQLRRADIALCHFDIVRLFPGRHRAELRDHRARIFPSEGSGRACRRRHRRQRVRNGVWRMGGGVDFRPDRIISRRLRGRVCRELSSILRLPSGCCCGCRGRKRCSLETLFAHDRVRKPVPTFRDHALTERFPADR